MKLNLRRFLNLPDPADRCVEPRCKTSLYDDGRCWWHWNVRWESMLDARAERNSEFTVHLGAEPSKPKPSLLNRMLRP